MSLTLTKITETSTTITLGWTPPAGVGGYLFYANGQISSVATANNKDGSPRKEVKFSKTSPGPPFHVVAVLQLSAGAYSVDVGSYAGSIPPPVSSFDIPRWSVTLPAGPGPRIGWWRQYRTPTTTLLNTSSGKVSPNLCTPAPNPRYQSGPRSWEWWVLGTVLIPGNFPNTGRSYATINPHNSSYDVGPPGMGGVGWGFGSGVSPWHIFFMDGQAAPDKDNDFSLYLDPSPSRHWPIVADVQRDQRYDFTIRVIWGRLDKELGLAGPGVPGGGIGDHPNGGAGRVWVYVNGELKADTGDRDTLHRALAPDGKTYTQTSPARIWDGAYCVPNLGTTVTMERTASRVGRTLAEALADGKDGFIKHSEFGEPVTGPTTTDLSPFRSSDFVAPAL